MDSLGRFRNSMKILHKIYKIINQDIFSASGYRRGRVYYLFVTLLLIMISFNAINLLFTNDLPAMVRVSQGTVLFAAIQVLCKYLSLADLAMLRHIIDYFDAFYCQNSRTHDKYHDIGQRYSRITEVGLKFALTVFISLLCITLVLAMYDSFRTGAPMLFCYFPFIHEYTLVQLCSLNIFTIVTHLIAAIAEPAGDAFIYVIVVNLTMIPTVIKLQMDELSTRLEQGLTTVTEIKRRWIHYIVIHQNYNE